MAAFLHACWQRRWQAPPHDFFAECLPPPQDAQAGSEQVSHFHSACSELSFVMRVQTCQASCMKSVLPHEPRLAP